MSTTEILIAQATSGLENPTAKKHVAHCQGTITETGFLKGLANRAHKKAAYLISTIALAAAMTGCDFFDPKEKDYFKEGLATMIERGNGVPPLLIKNYSVDNMHAYGSSVVRMPNGEKVEIPHAKITVIDTNQKNWTETLEKATGFPLSKMEVVEGPMPQKTPAIGK